MISQPFRFLAPTTVDEVLAAVGEGAKVLAGGMSLVPAMNLGLAVNETIVSLNHVSGLDGIDASNGAVRIGAMVRHRDVAGDAALARSLPAVVDAARSIGDVQVRNRGTIGGSCAHADPAADYLPALAAFGASFVLRSAAGTRSVPASEFFLGVMLTSLARDEVLTEIVVPSPAAGSSSAYLCLKRLEGSFAIVNAAAVIGEDAVTVAVAGAVPTPVVFRVDVAGRPTSALLDEVGDTAYDACSEAFGDLSGNAEYKRSVAKVYARRAVEAAVARRAGR